MQTDAVVLTGPEQLSLRSIPLNPPGEADVVVDINWSGISTGTERLLYTGKMPAFPGMGYPLVPGYESVGRVASAGERGPVLRWASWFLCRGLIVMVRCAACLAALPHAW